MHTNASNQSNQNVFLACDNVLMGSQNYHEKDAKQRTILGVYHVCPFSEGLGLDKTVLTDSPSWNSEDDPLHFTRLG